MSRRNRNNRNREEPENPNGNDPEIQNGHDEAENGDGHDGEEVVSVLDQIFDDLNEKRSSTREAALEKLINQLRQHYNYDLVHERRETIIEAIKRALKKGGAHEQVLGSRLSSLLTITIGAGCYDIYLDLLDFFRTIILQSNDAHATAAAIEALALNCFIAGESEADTQQAMQLIASIFDKTRSQTPIEVLESALNSWGLLATVAPIEYLIRKELNTQVRYFVKLLDDSDVDVRVTAGQNIALVTSLLNSNLIDQQDNDLRKQLKHYTDVEKLLDRLYDIRHDRRKSVFSQKEKKSMRQDLKEVVEIIETGKEPTEVLTIKHQKFTFETWPTLRQLDHFRSALAQGTHIHFEQNELLADIFGLEIEHELINKNMSAIEKRMTFSPNSPYAKDRTQNLMKDRAVKSAKTGSMMYGDD
jgi:hypothetical protein